MATLNTMSTCHLCRKISISFFGVQRQNYSRKASSQISHMEHCIQLVKKFDYENFLCTLLLPREARNSVFAVRAFNLEVAQIRDVVSDRNIGFMRIQFWKDAIQKIFDGSPPQTPVALELAKAVKKHHLSKQWFLRLLDAREENLYDVPHADLNAVKTYSEHTISSVLYLALESLGVRDVKADHAASHAGKALGLVTMIRGVRHNASHQRHVCLPTQLMIQHGVSQEDVIRGSEEQKMKDLVYDLASAAHGELEIARSLKKDVPGKAIPALLCTVICEAYLRSLQRTDFNIFDNRLLQRNQWLALSLFRQKIRGTY